MSVPAPSPTETIRLAGQLDMRRLPALLHHLQPLLCATEPMIFELDLSGVTFVTPCTLAVLRAATARVVALDLNAEGCCLREPDDERIAGYMRRMDVFKDLVAYATEEQFRRHEPVRFAPMVSYTDEKGAANAARDLVRSIGQGYTQKVESTLQSSIIELAENVALHSEALEGIAGAQGWLALDEVEVAIVDTGIGIPASLRKNPRFAALSDAEAMRHALEVHVSGLLDGGRGQGLWVATNTVARNGGRLFVQSGETVVKQSGDRVEVKSVRSSWPGTIATIRLHTDRTMDVSDLYERYFPSENEYQFVEFS